LREHAIQLTSILRMSVINILFFGDVVGKSGRQALEANLHRLKKEQEADFIIVNGENAAGGRGITPKITISLLRVGAAVVTLGDHAWDQREITPYIDTEPRLLRPINYPEGAPGQGSVILETEKGKVGVVVAQGRTFTQPPLDNPFTAIEKEIEKMREETPVIFAEIHAETTSEKIAMGRFLDGKVSAVVGTHTHVQTADEQIFPGGTAFLCAAGMCGPDVSVLGRSIEPVIQRFIDSLPVAFPVAKGAVRLCGFSVSIDMETGKAIKCQRVNELIENP